MSIQLHAPVALPPGTHSIGVGTRTGLDAAVYTKLSCPCRESKPSRSTRSPSLYRLSYPGAYVPRRSRVQRHLFCVVTEQHNYRLVDMLSCF
jgi:hypothetical protein